MRISDWSSDVCSSDLTRPRGSDEESRGSRCARDQRSTWKATWDHSHMADSPEVAHIVDLSLRIGEMLLSSGAGAADVTATMHSVAFHMGLRNPIVDVTFTSMSMSYQSDEDVPLVMIRQVKEIGRAHV